MELVESIVLQRTGRNLSTLLDTHDVLEYIKSNLTTDSPLIVSLDDGCLSLRCEESTLDCSAELVDSLDVVTRKIKTSWNITKLDLSRRCFSSNTELLEVCQAARMLKILILRDIQIQSCGDQSEHSSLIERIKWHCPALEEVDITGCSQAVFDELKFQTGRNRNESPFHVHVADLLSTEPEAKELLARQSITSGAPEVANRIKALVQEGVPANISYDGWSFLHTACSIGDADLVSWLLEKNGNRKYHVVNSNRPTALEMAIHCHNAPIVKQLLHETDYIAPAKLVELCFLSQIVAANECDVLHTNHANGCNPLQVVQLFIERSSLDFKSSFLVEVIKAFQRMSPRELRETCWTDDSMAEMFRALVSSGFSPDIPIKDLGSKTPLMCTVSSPVLVKTLLNLGANINATDVAGNTALFYAVAGGTAETADGHLAVSKILLDSKADPNIKNKVGETALLYDASSEKLNDRGDEVYKGCHLKIWELLVQSEAEINSLNKDRKSLMHLVIDGTKTYLEELPVEGISNLPISRCIQQIKFIVKHDNKLVRSRDSMGNTPLHLLANHNSVWTHEMLTIAKALIEVGSSVKVENDLGKTPLHVAKSWSMANFLLEQGAKPNALDDIGLSPLLCRCKEANLERPPELETLTEWSEGVKSGLDPWQEDNEGQNVFQILMESANFKDLELFIDAAINEDREAILRSDSKGNNLLHNLCNYNDSRVIPFIDRLLQRGANVNAQNENGDTTLHITCRKIVRLPPCKGNNSVYWKVIPKLLAYGAKYNLKNNANNTARNIVWFNKKLLGKLDKNVRQLEPDPIFPWIPISHTHHVLLSSVARGQNCQKVENFCYNVQPIGSGAYSKVYAAINVQDGREVALKRTDTYRLKTRQDDREVSSLLQLSNCQEIVKYIDFRRDTESTWITLELMEGTLDDVLKQGIFQESFPKLCKDVMRGVEYLHKNNILHRDLKPSNVLYTCEPSPCLKIADFGLSKKLGAGQGSSSVLCSNAGSRFWMAPELLLSTGHLQHTFQSDVFACGLIMHYMLAKSRHPFEGNTSAIDGSHSIADWNAVETNIINGNKTLSPDLSFEGTDLLANLLSSKKEDRQMASEALKHPFFWSENKKISFICAVGSQGEIGTYGRSGTVPSPVEQEIENNLGSIFTTTWDSLFPAEYREMTSTPRGRSYDTSSGVHLVRFIRNAYAHVSDRARPTGFQTSLLKDHVFLKALPNLFMVVFRAVKTGNWDTTRPDITSVMDSDD